jgi:hypothetical protein
LYNFSEDDNYKDFLSKRTDKDERESVSEFSDEMKKIREDSNDSDTSKSKDDD